MKKQLFLLSSVCLLLTACENPANAPERGGRPGGGGPQAPGQAETEADRTLNQKIRQALSEDESLSSNAKNVRAAISNGIVTLRGMVNNEKERQELVNKVKSITGVRNVNSQLEVARPEGSEEGRETNR
jgi:hyperosmotically inducible periplasmic protein